MLLRMTEGVNRTALMILSTAPARRLFWFWSVLSPEILLEPFEQVIADAQRVGHRGQRWVNRADTGKKACPPAPLPNDDAVIVAFHSFLSLRHSFLGFDSQD